MSIDYQQILMDMNRPGRRRSGSWKKLLSIFIVFAVLGGAGYAVWRYSLIGAAWDKAAALVGGFMNRDERAAPPEQGVRDAVSLELAAAEAGPPSASSGPVSLAPPPSGPISVAAAANDAPVSMPPPAAVQRGQAFPAAPTLRPESASAAAPPAPAAAPARNAAAPAPAPVLSETKAQIKAIDQLLTSNPSEALRRLETLAGTRLEADDAAEAGYRLGYAARMVKDEEKAEKAWLQTAEKWPASRGGRFSALALADTWYARFAGSKPQVSKWDDIQLMYSRVLGEDDAPFLPENVKAGVKQNLSRLNDTLFFGSGPTKLARYHKVESGELLGGIANRYRVDYESIARVNGINPNRIRAGMDLKIIVGDVSVVVRKHSKDPSRTPTVTWFLDGRWMREYPACVGDGDKTPAGVYAFTSKERDPSWTNPANGQLLSNNHPENILGSRWMAMKGMNTTGLGVHGTTVDDSVPGYTSAGCVRLHNADVEELFSYARIGGKVTVIE